MGTASDQALQVFGQHGAHSATHVRSLIRQGRWTSHTSGLADQHVQGNIVILPQALAMDFLLYCQRNPKPCPLLAVSEPGQSLLSTLGTDIDIRSDLPRYRVWLNGELSEEPTDITHLWRDDLVTFVIGCSFSFEQALMAAGMSLRHVDEGRNVAMYRTNIATSAAGPFHGSMVVSMRPMKPADAIRAVQHFTPPDVRILVVDNGSTDGSQQLVRQEFPAVHLIANAKNLGFAAAKKIT